MTLFVLFFFPASGGTMRSDTDIGPTNKRASLRAVTGGGGGEEAARPKYPSPPPEIPQKCAIPAWNSQNQLQSLAMEIRTFKSQRFLVHEATEIAAISGLRWKFAIGKIPRFRRTQLLSENQVHFFQKVTSLILRCVLGFACC